MLASPAEKIRSSKRAHNRRLLRMLDKVPFLAKSAHGARGAGRATDPVQEPDRSRRGHQVRGPGDPAVAYEMIHSNQHLATMAYLRGA